MKKLTTVLIAVYLLLFCRQVVPAETTSMVFQDTGINIDFQDALEDSPYYTALTKTGVISRDPYVAALCLGGYALPKETVYELNDLLLTGDADAQVRIMQAAQRFFTDIAYVIVTDAQDPEEAIGDLFGEFPEGARISEFGEADGYHYYEVLLAPDDPSASYDDLEEFGIDTEAVRVEAESYSAEVENLQAAFDERLKIAELYAPVDPETGVIGLTISFETTDLDGNTVTSDQLFRENRITMVNLWGTWCPHCVDEMEELTQIHTRLQEKDCGIVGIEWEQKPVDTMKDEIRAFMEEKGINFPSVIMPEGNAIFSQVTGYPTTFFVDSTGKILSLPISGARVDLYESTIDSLLAESEAGTVVETETETAGSSAYRVIACDPDGNPVEGAVIQLCDDVTCSFQTTDESGSATFETGEEKVYEVHVLQVPEGFEPDESVYNTQETFSDVEIVLDRTK